VRGSLTWHAPDIGPLYDIQASVNGSFVARQDRFDPAADLAPPPDAYALLGAALGMKADLEGQRLRFSVEGSNLLDARYRDYTSLLRYFADEPGLQLMVRLGAVLGDVEPGR
jgi:iron complex outermembrane receptor protein